MRFTKLWRASIAAVLLLLPATGPVADEQARRQRELEQVRARIGALAEALERDVAERDGVLAELRDAERRIAALRVKLASLRESRRRSETRREELVAEQAQRREDLAGENAALAAQVRAAYVNGREEPLRLVLNQSDPAAVGRQMVYYRYFNRSRLDRIERVRDHLAELARLETEVAAETRRLAELERRRAGRLAALEQTRAERGEIVARLDARIDAGDSELQRLRADERTLVELIEQIERALAEFPVESQEAFAALEGRLAWPVGGRLIGDFGQPRVGNRLRWNGVLVAAARGSEVRAVAHGRVAYADWLPGMGLLLVIEHGDGYLTLYGHNESLLRAAGDWVDAGEVVATVGDSGGQAGPALYFEIRRGRDPLDPHRWFAAAPGS